MKEQEPIDELKNYRSTNPYHMLAAAEQFNISADILRAQYLQYACSENEEERNISVSTSTSSIILYAFSIEIGLKALIKLGGDKPPYIHDLKKLFYKLSPKTQDNIKVNLPEERFQVNFNSYLERNKNNFENWRYIYEGGRSANPDFIQALSDTILKAGQNYDSD